MIMIIHSMNAEVMMKVHLKMMKTKRVVMTMKQNNNIRKNKIKKIFKKMKVPKKKIQNHQPLLKFRKISSNCSKKMKKKKKDWIQNRVLKSQRKNTVKM